MFYNASQYIGDVKRGCLQRMSQQDYFVLWSIYSIAAVILLLASIFFTNFLWRIIKEPIVIVVAILLFYPILIDPEKSQYAPAISVMAIDFLMGVGANQITIINQLTYCIEVVLVSYFVFAIFIRWPIETIFRKWYTNKKGQKQPSLEEKPKKVKKTKEAKEEFVYFKDSHNQPSLHADEKL